MRIELNSIELFGSRLVRPEGVMCTPDGSVWCSHGDGGCTRIAIDGTVQTFFGLRGKPNGICLDLDGSVIVANIGGGGVQRLSRDGSVSVVADTFDGKPITTANFPLLDRSGRLWVTNSTARADYRDALDDPQPDGSLLLIRDGIAREVANGLNFANGIAVDADERYVYVAETFGLRIVRYAIRDDGSVGSLEQYGPHLGELGYPDGIAFDAAGNLWVTLPSMNALGVIAPNGDWSIVLVDKPGNKLNRPTNICFGGEESCTAYVGSLRGTALARFRAPFPGMPLVHQL